MIFIQYLSMLIAIHFIADYTLQTEAVALGKNRVIDKAQFGVPWYYWMTSHAFTHAFGVGWFTGNYECAVFEFVTHFIIDTLKCHGKIGIHLDQYYYFCIKILIVIYLTN